MGEILRRNKQRSLVNICCPVCPSSSNWSSSIPLSSLSSTALLSFKQCERVLHLMATNRHCNSWQQIRQHCCLSICGHFGWVWQIHYQNLNTNWWRRDEQACLQFSDQQSVIVAFGRVGIVPMDGWWWQWLRVGLQASAYIGDAWDRLERFFSLWSLSTVANVDQCSNA